MRIEIVVEAAFPNIEGYDKIGLGNEVCRLVSNQLQGVPVELIHAASGPDDELFVPSDYAEVDHTRAPQNNRRRGA